MVTEVTDFVKDNENWEKLFKSTVQVVNCYFEYISMFVSLNLT